VRRLLLIVSVLLAMAACSTQARPEGVVERWLLALNQGSAGEPDRFAADELSQQVLPGWRGLDPGQLDVIEVARSIEAPAVCDAGGSVVPFRIEPMDGRALRATACVSGSRITQLTDRIASTAPVFPSEGGPPVHGTSGSAWWAAAAIGLALVVLGEVAMRLVRRRRPG
jgi:hypothetical protein